MIKFFRHIRKTLISENKMGKYFKYAVGEILLVVIGILIALQINNWNQKRIDMNTAQVYVENIKKEIMFHVEQMQSEYINRYERKISALEMARSYFEKPFIIEDSIEFINEISYGAIFNFGIEHSNIGVYESLISSGNIGLIETELRNEILDYYDYYDHASTVSQANASNYQNIVNGLRPFDVRDPKKINKHDQIRFINALTTEAFIKEVNIELSNGIHSAGRASQILKRGENLIGTIDNYLNRD